MKIISKGALPTMLVLVLSGLGASQAVHAGLYGDLPVNQSPLNWMKNCLIYTTDTISFPGAFKIFAGVDDPDTFRSDVCAVNSLTIGGLLGTAVPKEAPKQVDVALAAKTINLDPQSKSSECDYDTGAGGALNDNGAQVPCLIQRDVDLSLMPVDMTSVIPFPTITPGANDIVVPTKGTHVLTPGKYGRIVLNLNSTLVLDGAGNYEVRSLATNGASTRAFIEVTTPRTSLLVKEYLLLGHRSNINMDNTPLFKIFVEGGDGWNVPNWDSVESGVDYRGDGTVYACYVYSPNASQSWRGKPARQPGYTTQVFAANAFQNSGLNIKFVHPQDPDCFAPEFTCASIGRVAPGMTCNQTTGEVTLLSWGASEESLSYLLFIPATQGIPLVGASVNQLKNLACLEFTSQELTYVPPDDVENSIVTPNIFDSGVIGSCGDGTDLVPLLVGPEDLENGPDYPPVCYNVYSYEVLNVAKIDGVIDTCTVNRP